MIKKRIIRVVRLGDQRVRKNGPINRDRIVIQLLHVLVLLFLYIKELRVRVYIYL